MRQFRPATHQMSAHTKESKRNSKPAITPFPNEDLRRAKLHRAGVLQTSQGPYRCMVNDISIGGANLSLDKIICANGHVTLTIPGLGSFRGEFIWRNGTRYGMRFDDSEGVPAIGLLARTGRQSH